MLRAVLVAFLVAAAVSYPVAQQPRSTFRAGTDLVHFGVTVTDKKGNIVPGLTARDFEIVEVPGNHFSIFDEPNVATLADRIARTLSADAGTRARPSAPIAAERPRAGR